jgi:Galactose oxidase-like, Early set domain/Kelch motif
VGSWEVLDESSEVAAVHAALLPNGEVVYFSGNTGQDIPAATRIWNPTTRQVRQPPNSPDTDIFCCGLTPLWDGRLFVVGGTAEYANDQHFFIGTRAGYTLDPTDGWQRVGDMTVGRWYPSAIMLPNGRVLVVSGTGDDGELTPLVEIYNELEGWQLLPEDANRLLPLYPRLHVLPNGEIACLGNGQDLIFFNADTQTWREIGDAGVIPHADDDLAVLLGPAQSARILHTGGGVTDDSGQESGTAAAQIIDLTEDQPAWRDITPMNNPRWFPNSVLLPDGTLFVLGGGRGNNADPVMEPEIFDPINETWTTDAPMQVPRLYHSTAVLLTDGRVWTAGTDGETRMEVYTPDYLLRGARPTIADAPNSIAYGQNFSITLQEPTQIGSACFIRLSAVTHAFNMSQRQVALDFAQNDTQIDITALSDLNLAPPGHYMLFVLDANGVPSVAPIIQLVYA